MSKKYLDSNGLLYFWQKLKAYFALKVHTHSEYENVQADWNQTTTTADDYIKNKPTIPSGVTPSSTTPKMDGTATVGTETAFARGDHIHPSDTSRVPTSRTINGKALSSNVTIGAGDISSTIGEAGDYLDDDLHALEDGLGTKATGNARIFYGTSSTPGSTAAKVVTCSNYDALTKGDILVVAFTNANSASSPTLNVNSKGAKSIKQLKNGSLTNIVSAANVRGACIFVYDGTNEYWVLQSADDNTTYSFGTTSGIETGTSTDQSVWTPKVLHDYVVGAIETAVTGAATFQGTAPTTFAPTNYKKGYYWVVGTAGTYVGETCEPGDMIFAVADYNSAYSASDFNVIQTNLDITDISNSDIDTIVAS